MYWVLGTFDSEIDTLALTASILRSGESLGSCISYATGSARSVSLMTNLIIAAVVWFASVPSTTYTSLKVADIHERGTLAGAAEDTSVAHLIVEESELRKNTT